MNMMWFQMSNFLSDFGGTIGLWIGMSLFTFFEFLELGMDLVVHCGRWICRHNGRKPGTRAVTPSTPPPPYSPDNPRDSICSMTSYIGVKPYMPNIPEDGSTVRCISASEDAGVSRRMSKPRKMSSLDGKAGATRNQSIVSTTSITSTYHNPQSAVDYSLDF